MVNLLVGAFLLNLPQVDDVLRDSHTDGHSALEIRFHLDKLSVMVHCLQVQLFLSVVLLLLHSLGPLNCEILNLGPVLFINLISEISVFLGKVLDKVLFGSLPNALHLLHHLFGLGVVSVDCVRKSHLIQFLTTASEC